jgi:hypothetical protein
MQLLYQFLGYKHCVDCKGYGFRNDHNNYTNKAFRATTATDTTDYMTSRMHCVYCKHYLCCKYYIQYKQHACTSQVLPQQIQA